MSLAIDVASKGQRPKAKGPKGPPLPPKAKHWAEGKKARRGKEKLTTYQADFERKTASV